MEANENEGESCKPTHGKVWDQGRTRGTRFRSRSTSDDKQKLKKTNSGNESMSFANGIDFQDIYISTVGGKENHDQDDDRRKLGDIPKKDSGKGSSLAVEKTKAQGLNEDNQQQSRIKRDDSGNDSQIYSHIGRSQSQENEQFEHPHNCIGRRTVDKFKHGDPSKVPSCAQSVKGKEGSEQENARSLNRDDSGNDSQIFSPNRLIESHENTQPCEFFTNRDSDKLPAGNPKIASSNANCLAHPSIQTSFDSESQDSCSLYSTQNDRIRSTSQSNYSQTRNLQGYLFQNSSGLQVANVQPPMPLSSQVKGAINLASSTLDKIPHVKGNTFAFSNSPTPQNISEAILPPGVKENPSRDLDSFMQDRVQCASEIAHALHGNSTSEQANLNLSLTSLMQDSIPLAREIPNRAQVSRKLLNQMADELLKIRHSNQLLSQDLSKFQAEREQWIQEKKQLEIHVEALIQERQNKDELYQKRIRELEEEVQTCKFQKELIEQNANRLPATNELNLNLRGSSGDVRDRPNVESLQSLNETDSQHSHFDRGDENTEVKQRVNSDRGFLAHQQAVSSIDESHGEEFDESPVEEFDIEEVYPDEDTEAREDEEHQTELKTPV